MKSGLKAFRNSKALDLDERQREREQREVRYTKSVQLQLTWWRNKKKQFSCAMTLLISSSDLFQVPGYRVECKLILRLTISFRGVGWCARVCVCVFFFFFFFWGGGGGCTNTPENVNSPVSTLPCISRRSGDVGHGKSHWLTWSFFKRDSYTRYNGVTCIPLRI